MFKSIRIKNFQSHKDTMIEFDKGITILKGKSSDGKTAILRALNWVINNKPDGDSFRSWWGGDTEVTLTLEDGTEVIRRRTDKVNEYQIKETHYTALNRGVPEDIQALINMSDVNIQKQLDSAFLLNKSSGDIAKILNSTVDLSIIDETISNLTQEYNQVNSAIKQGREQIAYYVRELSKYKDLEEMQAYLSSLQIKEDYLIKVQKDITNAQELIRSFSSLSEELNEATDKVEYDNKVREVLESLATKQKEVMTINSDITKLDKTLKTYKGAMVDLSNIKEENKNLMEAENSCTILVDIDTKLDDTIRTCREIEETITIHTEHTMNYEQVKVELAKLNSEFKELMPDVCPLCEK